MTKQIGVAGLLWAASAAWGQEVPDYDFDWAVIDEPGNPGYVGEDPFDMVAGRGSVDYVYRIARREITTAQWLEFANTFGAISIEIAQLLQPVAWGAKADPFYFGPGKQWVLKDEPDAALRPVGGLEWYTCAWYVNWLHNAKSPLWSATQDGAYDASTFGENEDGTLTDQPHHHPDALFWIPTFDEWLKAAYYDADKEGGYWLFPNATDEELISGTPEEGGQTSAGEGNDLGWLVPVGAYADVQSPWGLLDVSGGAREWNEDINWGIAAGEHHMTKGSFAGIYGQPEISDRVWSHGVQKPYQGGTEMGLRVAGVAPSACAADFNGDGALDLLDFVAFQQAFQQGNASADANSDGLLNVLDFVAFQALFLMGCR